MSRLLAAPALALTALCLGSPPARAADPKPDASDPRVERIEDHLRLLQEELGELKQSRSVSDAKVAEVEEQVSTLQSLLERVRVGGYGSVRWSDSSLPDEQNTFTLRRLVLTTEAQLTDSMRFYSEIEYERFRKLELERTATREDGGIAVEQAIEGTNGSEIALEQAWFEWELDPALRLRTGGVLVPLGRFNLHHDDNQWNLIRRTLVDDGVPVIPVKSAWDELGFGLNGRIGLGETDLAYQLYVMNGAVIDPELESIAATRTGDTSKLAFEAKFSPQTGTFQNDVKEGKALAGRVAWTPLEGNEIAASFYTGRYTPDYLRNENVTSLSLDGIARFAGFELEGELVTTHWAGIRDVARSFAETAVSGEAASENAVLETEVEFELANLAKRKTGYWLELRYPFWPSFLPKGSFANPQLVPVGRFEQVWFDDRVTSLSFSNGELDQYQTQDRRLNRGTVGLAFRPTPLIVMTAQYEVIWTGNEGLAGLTNYLAPRASDRSAQTVSMGVSFGF